MIKALAAGAASVMLGSMLAGHDASPGRIIEIDGKKFKSYVGMGSLVAMERGGGDRYFQTETKKYVPEGIEGIKEYKGLVDDTLYQLVGGIKSGMGYNGSIDLPTLVDNAQFIKITAAGKTESHPHSVIISKEAPNYK